MTQQSGTQEKENVPPSSKMRVRRHVSIVRCLMAFIPGVNGRYLCQSVMHYLRASAVETEAQQ